MSDSETLFNQHIAAHMECIGEAAGSVAPVISAAAECVVESLLNEGQILTCGNGKANAFAQYFCSCMLAYHESDRPALPALNIGGDATTFSAIAMANRVQEAFSRQIQALGREGDTLILMTDDGNKSSMIQALQAAHDRHIRVIAITGQQETDIHSLLYDNDIELALPDVSPGRAAELIIIILNALCSQVESRLFGEA